MSKKHKFKPATEQKSGNTPLTIVVVIIIGGIIWLLANTNWNVLLK